MEQTKFFQSLSDETRLRILLLFEEELNMCVCEISYALDQAQPKISRHLAAMREAGLVQSSRHAQWIFYALNHDMPDWQKEILVSAINGNRNDPVAKSDRKRLKNMPGRPPRTKTT